MTLKKFSLSALRQATLLMALLGSLSIVSVSAVELVGKPVALSSSSPSAAIDEPAAQEEPDQPQAAIAIAAPSESMANHQFDPPLVGAGPFDSDGDDRAVIIVAIVFCIGGPILIILMLMIMHYRAKERREKNTNANIERLLAAGRDIPIELLRGDEPYIGDESALVKDDLQLQKGIKNVCLGVGLSASLAIVFGIEFGAIGLIVLSVGASQLWLWKLSGSSKRNKIQNQG